MEEGWKGGLEDSLRLLRGPEGVRLERGSKRERQEKERGGQNFPWFLESCTSEGGRWLYP